MSSEPALDRAGFAAALGALVVGVGSLPTAELLIVGIEASGSAPRMARTEVRYDLVGAVGAGRAERVGRWRIEWTREAGSTGGPSAGRGLLAERHGPPRRIGGRL